MDGVPYYETNVGKLDLNQITTDNVARIEIIKGAPRSFTGPMPWPGSSTSLPGTEKPFTGLSVESAKTTPTASPPPTA